MVDQDNLLDLASVHSAPVNSIRTSMGMNALYDEAMVFILYIIKNKVIYVSLA